MSTLCYCSVNPLQATQLWQRWSHEIRGSIRRGWVAFSDRHHWIVLYTSYTKGIYMMLDNQHGSLSAMYSTASEPQKQLKWMNYAAVFCLRNWIILLLLTVWVRSGYSNYFKTAFINNKNYKKLFPACHGRDDIYSTCFGWWILNNPELLKHQCLLLEF